MVVRIICTYITLQTKWAGWLQDVMQGVQGDIHYMWLCTILLGECVHMACSLNEKRVLLCRGYRYHRLVMELSTKISQWNLSCCLHHIYVLQNGLMSHWLYVEFQGPWTLCPAHLWRWEWVWTLKYTNWNCESANVADWYRMKSICERILVCLVLQYASNK